MSHHGHHHQHSGHHHHHHAQPSQQQQQQLPPPTTSSSPASLTYLQCPLCLDDFSLSNPKLQPRLLPSCAHSLCTRCLHQQWAIQAAEMAHPTFLCPIDSAPVRVTQVEDIPVNKILLGLLSMMSTTQQSEADFRINEFKSSRCIEEACDQEAVWYCFSDDANMCELHKQASHDGLKSNITKNHRLCRIEEKEMKKGPLMCEKHHSALLLWCLECRSHACHACATLQPHASHPEALKLLGNHFSNAGLAGLGLGADGFFSEHQTQTVMNIIEEEKKMKMNMEKEAKELIQTLQVIDSNELHTSQSLDTEFDNLIASLEQRRAEMHAELKRQSAASRHQLDSRMLQLSLNHSLTNTVLEESSRVVSMNPYIMVAYMDNLLVRHEKSLEQFWAYAYESSLVSWFPLRLAKDLLMREISCLGSIGIPGAPSFRLDECKADAYTMEIVWDPAPPNAFGLPTSNKDEKSGHQSGSATPYSRAKTNLLSPANSVTNSASLTTSSAAAGATSATSISFYILHMSPLDPFDLSQDHVNFVEIYRGPQTAFPVSGLQPGSSYLFRVQAVSLMGEGIWSQKICMSTLNKQPGAPNAPASSSNSQSIAHQRSPSFPSNSQPQQQPNILSPSRTFREQQQLQPHQPAKPSPLIVYSAQPSPVHQSFNGDPTIYTPNGGYQTPYLGGVGPNGYIQQPPFQIHVDPAINTSHSTALQSPAYNGGYPTMSPSVAHSVVPSRRNSLGGGGSGSHNALIGPTPIHAQRAPHPQAHPPSLQTGWEDLWKLSVILREKDVPCLMRFFQPIVPSSFQLLYRSSRDGFSTNAFHLHADGMGPTLTVIRVKKDNRDYVFGGFAMESWSSGTVSASGGQSQGHWLTSNQVWLFSLINAYKRNLKFKLKKGQEKFAQYCDAKHAAMFGVGGDLVLNDPLDSPHHHFGLDSFELDTESDLKTGLPKFTLPPNANGLFSSYMLSGGEVFQCKEVECYAVNLEQTS